MSERPNIPLPDELADIRAQIQRLEERQAMVRKALIADPSARTGAAWAVEVKEVTSNRTDLKELRAMHADLVAEYTFPQTVTQVVLKQITEDGEIIHPRRKDQAA